MGDDVERLMVLLYEESVPDWPGEVDFYRRLAAAATARGGVVLEVACGTGRIARRLARDGATVVGLDLSPEMIAAARARSGELATVRWAVADMRSFDLGLTAALVIIPGHSFQFLLTPEDQMACLAAIRRHLEPDGRLVIHLDHQDMAWLGGLGRDPRVALEPAGERIHPETGQRLRVERGWAYERESQTASVLTVWEALDADGAAVDRWERGPVPLHCVFRFEMAHLLTRAGLVVETVHGDFSGGPLTAESTDMVWVACQAQGGTDRCGHA